MFKNVKNVFYFSNYSQILELQDKMKDLSAEHDIIINIDVFVSYCLSRYKIVVTYD